MLKIVWCNAKLPGSPATLLAENNYREMAMVKDKNARQ